MARQHCIPSEGCGGASFLTFPTFRAFLRSVARGLHPSDFCGHQHIWFSDSIPLPLSFPYGGSATMLAPPSSSG